MKLARMSAQALLVLLLMQGCAFSRGTIGDEIKSDAVASIKKGGSTKMEVVSLLGAPDRVLQVNGRDVYQYYRYDAKAGSLLLILVNFSRLTVKSDDLFVMMNQNGIVEDVIVSKRTAAMEFRFWPSGTEDGIPRADGVDAGPARNALRGYRGVQLRPHHP